MTFPNTFKVHHFFSMELEHRTLSHDAHYSLTLEINQIKRVMRNVKVLEYRLSLLIIHH